MSSFVCGVCFSIQVLSMIHEQTGRSIWLANILCFEKYYFAQKSGFNQVVLMFIFLGDGMCGW